MTILRKAIEMKIKIVSSYPKGIFYICDDGDCTYKFSDITVETIYEICDIIKNAENSDAITYFKFM